MSKTESLFQKAYEILNKVSKYSYIKADVNKSEQKTENTPHSTKKENRDSLPIGLYLFGFYKDKTYFCKIDTTGNYIVNNKSYKSLSEAARAVTGVRTEGWRFWKIYKKGPSILDIFRRN